jgi:hypothetical protein
MAAACNFLVSLLLISCSAELSMASTKGELDQVSVAGVQKVINMLSDMSAKAKLEKKNEEVAFAEFSTWCKSEIPALKKSIAQGSEEIELLSSETSRTCRPYVPMTANLRSPGPNG